VALATKKHSVVTVDVDRYLSYPLGGAIGNSLE
jgi:hypothetical protein